MENLNVDKNIIEIPEEKLKELGILKVLKVVIGENETNYLVIDENGEKKLVPASELTK